MPLRRRSKLLIGAGVGVVATLFAIAAGRAWVVPALIARAVGGRLGGEAEFQSWWLNGRSAGVVGLVVRERPGSKANSAPWLTAELVTTDLSLGKVVRGVLSPGRVVLKAPSVTLRFDERGELLTRLGRLSGEGATAGKLPVVIAEGAQVTIHQEGRPEMVVNRVTARLGPEGDAVMVAARSGDADWGPCEAIGRFSPDFATGRLDLKTLSEIRFTPARVASIPFVPPEVWEHVRPDGDVGVALTVERGRFEDNHSTRVRAEIALKATKVTSPTLDLTLTGATGRVIVDGARVTLDKVAGRSIGGRVVGNGTLDFRRSPAVFDVALDLDKVNVADTPSRWQLDEAGVTGLLTGKVKLHAVVGDGSVDLSGTTGTAVVEGGTLAGIPVKSLSLSMTASGDDLRYSKPGEKSSGLLGPSGPFTAILFGLQPPVTKGASTPPPVQGQTKDEPAKPLIQLPKSLSTRIELEDVNLGQLIARAEALLGFPFPLPITGRLSMKADATIPIGRLHEIKGYAFHGDVTLAGASIYRVDVGRVSARVDLQDGVLVLSDLRGKLVDRPSGGPDNPPAPTDSAAVPASGPLPAGGFRGTLRAEIDPPGKFSAHFEGNDLPLGELLAPALPRPTPLSGLATATVSAEADLHDARDPSAWTVTASATSRQIHYKDATLDGIAARFDLTHGRLTVPELTATMGGRPLSARLGLDLKPPQAFSARVDVTGWDVSDVLAWVPNVRTPSAFDGTITARAGAEGTLSPRAVQTQGEGRFDRLQAGPVTLGDVPFGWSTKGDTVVVTVADARPFGGRASGEATVPLTAGKPVTGAVNVSGIDTAKLSASIPGGGLKLSGTASGRADFTIPPDASKLEAHVGLSAPDLTVQGVPAERVHATVRAVGGLVNYEVTADSLGGKVRFKGDIPLGQASPPVRREANGELQAVDFRLERGWASQRITGALAKLAGRGAIDANVRFMLGGPEPGPYVHGVAELRDLRWESHELGRLRGIVAATPTVWRIDPLTGELFGGAVSGNVWGTSPSPAAKAVNGAGAAEAEVQVRVGAEAPHRQFGFELRVDRASLKSAFAFIPVLGRQLDGFGALRCAGTFGETLHATADFTVARARMAGLPLTELRIPAELATPGGNGSGVLHVRRWSARFAGGQIRGDASFRVGSDHSFRSEAVLTDVDLESIARIYTEARRPASGQVSGKVTVGGSDPSQTKTYRGKVDLALNDASVFALPVFREIDKLLGSARGGLFEEGHLSGTIAGRQIIVDPLTMEGRLAQMHASGTVGFDGQLNLVVLVNTNEIISQTGQALVAAIPGLRGRNRGASLQVANYLSNRLLKFRVSGTVRNPSVSIDPAIAVAEGAVGFFGGVLKLPLELIR
jgi:translocation and assembly module TamB